jgi:hypothetical protein
MRGDQKSDAYPQITNLEWNQGQDIRIILEDDWTVWRGGARPNLIDETYSGPYAPWKLDKDGQKLRRGDAWIRYDVVPQSGPPRNLFKPITLPTPP